MPRHLAALCSTLPLAVLLPVSPAASTTPQNGNSAKELHALFEAEWERGLRENPTGATYIGDHRYDDRWPDASADRNAGGTRG